MLENQSKVPTNNDNSMYILYVSLVRITDVVCTSMLNIKKPLHVYEAV